MPPPPRPILGNEAALTILPTGVVKIRESKQIFDRVISDENIDDNNRSYKAKIAYSHEFVHFFQSFTTAYVFNYCEKVRSLTVQFSKWLSNPERDAGAISPLTSILRQLENDLDHEIGSDPIDGIGVSPRQLMEATAVLESLRSLRPVIHIDELFEEIPRHTDGGVLYGRVLGVILRALGPSAAINLTPAIVFLALNDDQPGTAFSNIIAQLYEYPQSSLAKLSASEVLDTFAPNREGSLISQYAKERRLSKSPFWNDIGIMFAKSGNIDLLYLVAAYPSSILAESTWSKQLDPIVGKCVPPIIMFEDGMAHIQGIARDWSDEMVIALLTTNEIIGVMYRIGLDQGYETLCVHFDCPARASALCHMAYPPAPPSEGKWQHCGFRERFQAISGVKPEHFAQQYDALLS